MCMPNARNQMQMITPTDKNKHERLHHLDHANWAMLQTDVDKSRKECNSWKYQISGFY